MPRKSTRVVLTLLGSAAFGVGCTRTPPQPARVESEMSQIEFEQEPPEVPSAAVGAVLGGVSLADPEENAIKELSPSQLAERSPTSTGGHYSSSHYHGHMSHYGRRSVFWPMLWGTGIRPNPAPRSVVVPREPTHASSAPPHRTGAEFHPSGIAPHSSITHGLSSIRGGNSPSSTTHSTTHSGTSSHISSRGFGSTGHSISGGS